MARTPTALRKLLGHCRRDTLLRLTAASALPQRGSKKQLTRALARVAGAEQILLQLLTQSELVALSRKLGLPTSGLRVVLARRVFGELTGWRAFAKARRYARSQGLAGTTGWKQHCAGQGSRRLPLDVPPDPHRVYRDAGWRGYRDWLGAGPERKGGRRWRTFADARTLAQSLGLGSSDEWRAYCRGELRHTHGRKPEDVPACPARVYALEGEWLGWRDFLGTGFLPFEEARQWARAQGLSGNRAWRALCRAGKRPARIPATPEVVYRGVGWISWGDWFGTGTLAPYQKTFLTFERARAYVRRLGLRGGAAYRAWCRGDLPGKPRRPRDVPTNPQRIYREHGWTSWGDWLGTGTVATHKRRYRSFEAARRFARSLGLLGLNDWRAFVRGGVKRASQKPEDVPANPHRVYVEWTSWGDWLGTGNVATKVRARAFLGFEEARAFARRLRLRSETEWRRWCVGELPKMPARPAGVPTNPRRIYRDTGWKGWGDWLGTGNVATGRRVFWSFSRARRFARRLRLRSQTEWKAWCKGERKGKPARPPEVPTNPWRSYADQWQGWNDWLGTQPRR